MVQSLNLQAELRGGGVSQLWREAQVWELHAAAKEEHWGGQSWGGGRDLRQVHCVTEGVSKNKHILRDNSKADSHVK